jgi:UDP-GlcNAc3NAcA epimerase
MQKTLKIVTVIGARPQFIKAASLSRYIASLKNVEEIIVHTGQHFDANMSTVFFDEMKIPKPKYNLAINSVGHGAMTGRMIEGIEKILLQEKPNWLLVYGDTNSTIAGALAAKKLHIKVAHVEAGLRSFNMEMPEEINRILTDRISDVLFCPTQTAVDNLLKEGYKNIPTKIINVGDIMYDSALFYSKIAKGNKIKLPKKYVLATIHRAENTNSKQKLENIFKALDKINSQIPVVLPLHPRTKNYLKKYNIESKIHFISPVGYLEMVSLIKNAKAIITDSGGLQKEAYFFKKRCFTLRDQTEWVELIQHHCNQLVNVLTDDIAKDILSNINKPIDEENKIYGKGNTSQKIIDELFKF